MALRVMTYNVRYFGHALPLRGAASTRKALQAIARAVAGLEHLPHVLCLQEVETRSLRSRLSHTPGAAQETQLEALMHVLEQELEAAGHTHRFQAHYFPAHTYGTERAKIYTTGLAVLARDDVQILKHNSGRPQDITHRRSNGFAKRLKQSRVCAHATVVVPSGKSVDVFNTHLSLPKFVSLDMFKKEGRMGYGANQEREVDALVDFVEAERRSDRFLLMGDFNSLPDSPAYNRVLERLDVQDPFPQVLGVGPAALRSAFPTAGFMHLRMRLDHIFAGRALECVDLEDSHPFGESGRWHGLSDHIPLIGRFRVR